MQAYPPITPYLAVKDAAAALDFYARAFGAEEVLRVPRPEGGVMHAELRVGGGLVMLADETPAHGFLAPRPGERAPAGLMVAWPSPEAVDAVFARAVAAGGTAETEPRDEPWGARFAAIVDPAGHRWWLYAMRAG